MRLILKKTILISVLILLSVPVGITVFNAIRFDLLSFEKNANHQLEKATLLKTRAQTFDETKALAGLGMNKTNGFYYRFDEHLGDAERITPVTKKKEMTTPSRYGFEFSKDDPVSFHPNKGTHGIENGIMKCSLQKDDYLKNSVDLSIPKDDIGEIAVRIKVKESSKIEIAWSRDPDVQPDAWWGVGRVTIYTTPDNKFHTYRIDAQTALKRHLKYGDSIRKVFLSLQETEMDEIEIDYIRFISKMEKYAAEPYGTAYETMEGELRKVLYMNAPLGLSYTMDIPDDSSWFKFGMGILEDKNPVQFRIIVKHDNAQKEVFSRNVAQKNVWYDRRIDFSEWAGKSIEIFFETNSQTHNTAFWSNPVIYTRPRERFNVVFILEDALRADHLSCYGYERQTTPVKDEFVRDGALFLNAFSQATNTRPSCSSMMTSLYPTATGVWGFSDTLNDRYMTLPEIMRSQGFATASFLQNSNGIGPSAGTHQGYSYLFDPETAGHRAEHIYGELLQEWIEEQHDRNFFIYLHLLDPHGVYEPPQPFDSWYRQNAGKGEIVAEEPVPFLDPKWVKNPTDEGRRNLYDGEIRYNDYQFGKFLDILKEKNLLQNTLFVFTADHGEYLGEHGLWTHHPPGYVQVLHVPLIMVYPKKIPKDKKITRPVQLIDVMPTILDIASIDRSDMLLAGDSLVPLMKKTGQQVWNERICLSEEVIYKDRKDNGAWASLFFQNHHILNSKDVNDTPTKRLALNRLGPGRHYMTTRVFDYLTDEHEERFLKSYFIDIFFQSRVKRFIGKMQETNTGLWKALTSENRQTIMYSPEELERLKALGYLE